MEVILENAKIEKILLNGTKAYELYAKYYEDKSMPPAVKVPSTSPANAVWTLGKLIEAWEEEM